MNQKALVVFSGYLWTKTLLGITFYPYRYVRVTIRRPVLLPVLFSPLIGFIILLIAAKIASTFIAVTGIFRELVAIFLSTTALSILLWQVLLVYLLVSYLLALWNSK